MAGISVKGAESAFIDADVGIVDIPVHNKGDNAFGMKLLSHAVGPLAEVEVAGVFQKV
jgi:hypothetical protein